MAGVKDRSKIDDENMVGYSGLAIAIVKNAIYEYSAALKNIMISDYYGKKMPDYELNQLTISEVERFFFGGWYESLCNIDPNIVLGFAKAKGEKAFKDYVEARKQADARRKKI